MQNNENKNKEINKLTEELVIYLTKYTDYLANPTIRTKDIAICRLFLHPFKWDQIPNEMKILGPLAIKLMTKIY